MMKNAKTSTPEKNRAWLYDLLLIVVLLFGAYFRFAGADWGQLSDQHPDELFYTSVTYDIQPVHSLAQYFDTAKSTLNPYNTGHTFYVYGTLPLFTVRYLASGLGQMNNLKLFGRYMAALSDLGTIVLLYFIVKRVYGGRVALLAAAFDALAVMQIQQSHFYTSDSFVIFFIYLALYFAVLVATEDWSEGKRPEGEGEQAASSGDVILQYLSDLFHNPLTYYCLAFGLALGMATASKVNAAVLAVMLPIALLVRYFRVHTKTNAAHAAGQPSPAEDFIARAFVFLVIGAIVSLLTFRVFQPYAFVGLKLNPQWLSNLREYLSQASPNADMAWSLQWARRTHLYSFQNLTTWGLGLPLGILAWAGFLWMGWRILRGEWRQHLLLWFWTAGYFTWQSLQWNPTMRYQLPVYPLLAMTAAWCVFEMLRLKWPKSIGSRLWPVIGCVVGGLVLVLTLVWAYAFTRIYVRPETRVAASDWIFQNVPGPLNLRIRQPDGTIYNQPLPFAAGTSLAVDTPFDSSFAAHSSGVLTEIFVPHALDGQAAGVQTLTASLMDGGQNYGSATVSADFVAASDPRGQPYALTFPQPIPLVKDTLYTLHLSTTGGLLSLTGASFTQETDADYGLPFRINGYDPFGGIYRGDLNLQVYWDDNADKVQRFLTTLDQADYIFIPTAHQYTQITRIPERFPLTTVYYRELLGCPADKTVIWCYKVATPGMFHGNLGFDLVEVFTSYPGIGPLQINDQSAEEAFWFYDHPKVMIFAKRADYDPARVQAILGAVDLSQVVHLTPGQANSYKDEMLPADQLAIQQAGGTWSQLFDWNALQNKYPGLGVVLWYMVMFLVGLCAYPIVRAALPGLSDHGYPLARTAGLVIWAWFSWIAGSFGISYSKLTIAIALGLIALIGGLLAYRQRAELKEEWRTRKKYFLVIEGLFLTLFLLDLLIRLGNPDLWHDPNGGERPMEFAYFNAILKSTTFPPYDPWYAGGYINYYYYGYVIVGTPVKLLGIVPSIAYNFILPTLFACLGLGGFSVVWNLMVDKQEGNELTWKSIFGRRAFIGGLSGTAAMVLLGNLGIARLFYRSFMCQGAPGSQLGNISVHDCIITPGSAIDKVNIFARLWWIVKGFFLTLSGRSVDFTISSARELYWGATRVLPANTGGPITEFPLASFLWSDLHAHMMALFVTVLAIAWVLSVVLAKAKWKSHLDTAVAFILGGVVIGALKPANTWDFYTYLLLAAIVLVYVVWRYLDVERIPVELPAWMKRLFFALGAAALLAGLSSLFYQPFTHWFEQAYNSFDPWMDDRSDIGSYLVHWGVFLFFIVSWMVWETRQWMAATPVSSLRKLKPYRDLIIGGLVLLVLLLVGQQVWVMHPAKDVHWYGVSILWLALPLAAWAGVLILRPGLPDIKRLVLFMVGTALVITMFVELFVVKGDIGRQNTVFKFYMQAWTLLGLSAAAAFNWLWIEFRKWLPGWRTAWCVTASILTACAAFFLFIYGAAKVRDRMSPEAPHTLDGMTYMAYTTQFFEGDVNQNLDLREDYLAIRWMQENVQGSPVIVEAAPAGVQYTWLSRFSIYTGLPDIVGWQWHQQQQRVLQSDQVVARGVEVGQLYLTDDVNAARDFLRKYNARYIIVGQLERAKYPGVGLLKFETQDGLLWREVYRDGQTVIYEVLP